MINESATAAMQEIYDIRFSIYEEIKDMKPEARTAYFSESAREPIKKYGIKIGVPRIKLSRSESNCELIP